MRKHKKRNMQALGTKVKMRDITERALSAEGLAREAVKNASYAKYCSEAARVRSQEVSVELDELRHDLQLLRSDTTRKHEAWGRVLKGAQAAMMNLHEEVLKNELEAKDSVERLMKLLNKHRREVRQLSAGLGNARVLGTLHWAVTFALGIALVLSAGGAG